MGRTFLGLGLLALVMALAWSFWGLAPASPLIDFDRSAVPPARTVPSLGIDTGGSSAAVDPSRREALAEPGVSPDLKLDPAPQMVTAKVRVTTTWRRSSSADATGRMPFEVFVRTGPIARDVLFQGRTTPDGTALFDLRFPESLRSSLRVSHAAVSYTHLTLPTKA